MSDDQAIRELIDTWLRAAAEGDLDKMLTLMAEDAVFLTPGNPPMRGKQDFAAAFRSVAAQLHIEGAADVQEIQVMGDWAYCWTRLTITMTPIADGTPAFQSGHTLTEMRKN